MHYSLPTALLPTECEILHTQRLGAEAAARVRSIGVKIRPALRSLASREILTLDRSDP